MVLDQWCPHTQIKLWITDLQGAPRGDPVTQQSNSPNPIVMHVTVCRMHSPGRGAYSFQSRASSKCSHMSQSGTKKDGPRP